jgi:hypothetical protein
MGKILKGGDPIAKAILPSIHPINQFHKKMAKKNKKGPAVNNDKGPLTGTTPVNDSQPTLLGGGSGSY